MYKTLQPTKIKQKSEKWLELKRTKIGSSEIYGLVKNYIKPQELESLGINSAEFTEKPYTTAWELYHKFTNPNYVGRSLSWELAEYGNSMEKFAFKWLKKGNFKYQNSIFTQGNVYANDNDIRIASLDIEGETDSKEIIKDANGNYIALGEDKNFIIEVKAMSKFKASKNQILTEGVDWKYILQLQWQLWCRNINWGAILVFELLNDTQANRGYVIRCGETLNKKDYEYIDNATQKRIFFYKRLPQYEKIFELALERFMNDVKFKNEPKFVSTENKAFWIQQLMRRDDFMNSKRFDFKKNTLSFNAEDKSINILDGTFEGLELFKKDKIIVFGSKNNNKRFNIKSISDNKIIVKEKIEDEFNVKNIELCKKLSIFLNENFTKFFKQYKKKKKETEKYEYLKNELEQRLYSEGKLVVNSRYGKISYGATGRITVKLEEEEKKNV